MNVEGNSSLLGATQQGLGRGKTRIQSFPKDPFGSQTEREHGYPRFPRFKTPAGLGAKILPFHMLSDDDTVPGKGSIQGTIFRGGRHWPAPPPPPSSLGEGANRGLQPDRLPDPSALESTLGTTLCTSWGGPSPSSAWAASGMSLLHVRFLIKKRFLHPSSQCWKGCEEKGSCPSGGRRANWDFILGRIFKMCMSYDPAISCGKIGSLWTKMYKQGVYCRVFMKAIDGGRPKGISS